MADTQKSEDSLESEAMAALQSMFPKRDGAGEPEPVAEPGQAITASAEVPTEQAETEAPAEPVASVTEPEPVSEDVKALLAERDAARAEAENIRSKFDKSAGWARDLALRKANEVAVRDQLLKRIASGEEVSREEVEKILAGGPAPQPQYQAPVPQYGINPFAPAPAIGGPDPALTELDASRFMVEHRMSDDDAAAMVAWMQKPDSGLTQDDMVPGSPYQTLRLVHEKYTAHLAAQKAATAGKVASVARTQRAVAKAAGAITGAAKATPAPPIPPDPSTMDPETFVKSGAFDKALSDMMNGRA